MSTWMDCSPAHCIIQPGDWLVDTITVFGHFSLYQSNIPSLNDAAFHLIEYTLVSKLVFTYQNQPRSVPVQAVYWAKKGVPARFLPVISYRVARVPVPPSWDGWVDIPAGLFTNRKSTSS